MLETDGKGVIEVYREDRLFLAETHTRHVSAKIAPYLRSLPDRAKAEIGKVILEEMEELADDVECEVLKHL